MLIHFYDLYQFLYYQKIMIDFLHILFHLMKDHILNDLASKYLLPYNILLNQYQLYDNFPEYINDILLIH
jgi:hypothetical protein